MIAILRKDAAVGLVCFFVLWPLLIGAELVSVGGLDLGLVLINSCFVLVFTVGSVLINEIEEETNGEYGIFDGLPVRRIEIVGTKFGGPLMLTFAFACSHWGLATFWGTQPEQAYHVRTVILASGVLTLMVVGVLYVGVFSVGLAKTVASLGISFWTVSASFIVAVTFLGWNADSAVGGVVEFVGRTDHGVLLLVGFLFYGLAWLTAVRCHSSRLAEVIRTRGWLGALVSLLRPQHHSVDG